MDGRKDGYVCYNDCYVSKLHANSVFSICSVQHYESSQLLSNLSPQLLFNHAYFKTRTAGSGAPAATFFYSSFKSNRQENVLQCDAEHENQSCIALVFFMHFFLKENRYSEQPNWVKIKLVKVLLRWKSNGRQFFFFNKGTTTTCQNSTENWSIHSNTMSD